MATDGNVVNRLAGRMANPAVLPQSSPPAHPAHKLWLHQTFEKKKETRTAGAKGWKMAAFDVISLLRIAGLENRYRCKSSTVPPSKRVIPPSCTLLAYPTISKADSWGMSHFSLESFIRRLLSLSLEFISLQTQRSSNSNDPMILNQIKSTSHGPFFWTF